MQNNAKICVGGSVLWKDKFLILFKPKKNWWEFPGGKLKEGETPSKAAEREVFEETGLNLHTERLEGLFNFISNKTTMIYLKFLMKVYDERKEPLIILSKEHNNYKWLSASAILKYHRKDISPLLLKYLTKPTSSYIYDINVN